MRQDAPRPGRRHRRPDADVARPRPAGTGTARRAVQRHRADPQPLVVRGADNWVWSGTGVADGDRIPGVVAGEADGLHAALARPAGTTLSASPYPAQQGGRRLQSSHVHETARGAVVFASGTLGWTLALDRQGHRDPRIERATANVLNRMAGRRRGTVSPGS
ncbi:N,N-dimethylformamidase beta subunit family domain-containing protein [Micromonospora sp. BRA006-A]|nr:N,N-dimethylformamidase beta subunit family domain-containing protein [Micromonospora sp. BRA006-A]